ncbi:phosphoribosylglycinamide formyltransferase [Liquorilactobacillus satsumensis]|uniref:phosphoribosylglycinamide formyltransferase n=1 Tax=Liquorilactobacillus satsumensis TaxID=259059 RepID=UPI0021C446E3|nr:phosphoribosylglycinamide formyltransferase [Liquorilactobacillus satsumensis]MCP9312680.1 phosphoribosylglycinamide formyltransferase [Liquorilactobacillus satsumensis]MCP9359866.1 phosphoribosylglycinamide formyltransferase [Liquorilactobacillus satsumensis]
MKIAIFASGNGSNFEIFAQMFAQKELPGELALLFCDHPDAYVVQRAQQHKVPIETFTVKECGDKVQYEHRILEVLRSRKIDFIILAGYLRVIGNEILQHFEGRIVNLHPAYLPEYPGLHSIERAFADKRAETGVTVHYVDAGLDSGPIIAQRRVPILKNDTVAELEKRIHAEEHQLYPAVVKKILLALQ